MVRTGSWLGLAHQGRGYGTELLVQGGARPTDVRFLVEPDTFVRPPWRLQVDGVEPCLELLGATGTAGQSENPPVAGSGH